MNHLPKLITFDGEARSGKGTVVQATKDYLRDECGMRPMLIDRGQTFRVLVVAATRSGVDLDDATALDNFLTDERNIDNCTQLVKDVYHMDKQQRDGLLYTNEVGANSAKVGARPASQVFVAGLTKKWLRDARNDGFDVVLIDGRSLESIAREMHSEGLCDYRLGLYFVCDARRGAIRTLGFAPLEYDQLQHDKQQAVDELVEQIAVRNHRDFERSSEPLIRPLAPICKLPDMSPAARATSNPPMLIIDTSANLAKDEMSFPVAKFVAQRL